MPRLRTAAALLALFFTPGLATAESAFVEGHVFNKRTGAPLSGAMVRVFENVTSGPVPVELAAGVTDANGFYQFTIDEFLGFQAVIEVVCDTPVGGLRGESSAPLREGLVFRRDVYIEARRLARCRPPAAE